jgi:superfamily II DNA or RNA helicase
MHLQEGQRITAPFLSAVAEVKRFEPKTGYYLLEVVLQDGHNTYQPLRITEDQLASVQVTERDEIRFLENAEDLFFYIEANRIRLAYQFDPQLAVSVSQVDPLPHQIEAVYHHVLRSPKVRFLLADDPGAGKTIMAGLILKELQYRQLVRRVLVVAPGHLKYQWQREMKERFQTPFVIVDRARIHSTWGENVWEETDRCITSIDFIKQDDVRTTLASTHWDLVIVDEAHKMAAYAYETRRGWRVDKTKRYQAGEVLSRCTNHMLFLTATPHKGDEENFRLFLDLLRPGFFAQAELLRESVENEDNPILLRRLKEDMRRFDGTKIFPPRHIQSVKFPLTPAELDLYNGVTHYVRDYYDRARENRSISFALVILQRRLTSSSHAIYRSLGRRRDRLQELLSIPDQIRQQSEDYLRVRHISEEELEDMAEEERARVEEQLEYLTIARNIEEVKAEVAVVEALIAQAEEVRAQEVESKLVHLRDQVLVHLGERKLLVFTEFRDTLDYLVEKLQGWGYDVGVIHGGMSMDDRIQAEHDFRHQHQILVATEAAGEGINLQFCSLMVNYDIPWNPNRLEQRMGRVHRYGQDREVYIWNMISKDTREGQILDRLFEKLDAMREALGSDRVFDIIGEIIPGARLDELLKDAIFSQRRIEEIEEQIEVIGRQGVEHTLERVFLSSLATRHIDYTGLLQETLQAEENRLVPEYVGDYFQRAFRRFDGRIERRPDLVDRHPEPVEGSHSAVYTIPSVPYELRRWNDDYNFKTAYGVVQRAYRQVTFDKAVSQRDREFEFVAPGHPLLEALNETVLRDLGGGDGRYAIYGDPEGVHHGALWFVQGEILDGTGQPAGRRVFCLYQDATSGDVRRTNPAVLWDLEPLSSPSPSQGVPRSASGCCAKGWGGGGTLSDPADLLSHRDAIEDHIIAGVLLPFRAEIAARREHEAQVKERYGLRSLDYLVQESNQKLLDYQLRQAGGEQMDMPILNERRNLEGLEQRRRDLEREIRLERNLTVGEPRILGAAVVVPLVTPEAEGLTYDAPVSEPVDLDEAGVAYGGMRRDEEIEAVGMREAMAYEREHGWNPEDVSAENLGFDIRSTRYNDDGSYADTRYIEVKARAHMGAIRLSANEWKQARKFGKKYWLYIVIRAATDDPQVEPVPDPASQFQVGEDIFSTGFIIPEDRWRERTER